jgi:hypothetical protein
MAPQEIDRYLAAVGEPGRATLEELRRSILAVIPDAQQCISYGMPAFKVRGKTVAGFAAFFESIDYTDAWSRIQAAILCAFALLIVVISVLTYGLVAVRIQSGPYIGSDKAAALSVIVFLLSFVVGAFALLFSLRQRGMQAKLLTAERSL